MPDISNGSVGYANGSGIHAIDLGVALDYPSDRGEFEHTVLGADPRLRSGTVIYAGSRIGARLTTGHHVVIREENIVGDDVSIWTNSVIDYGCRIGDRVKIHSNCYVAQYTVIDEDAFLAPGVTIANDLYPRVPGSRTFMSGPHIEAGARIGVNVTLLPFVRIGAGALIGSGAVVTRDIPPGMVAYGSPARVAGRVADLVDIVERVAPDASDAERFQLRDTDRAAGFR
jgi:acetyltransferase-like isoleucine patch superfamily enzyme